jgi:polyphosphate kinase
MALDAPVKTDSTDRFLNRELSWLDFGARVLDLAEDPSVALLERLKFLAIFSEGLDEFFEVRVAGLKDQVASGLRTTSADGMTPVEQLRAIRERVEALVARQDAIFLEDLVPKLAKEGVIFASWESLDARDRAWLDGLYEREIFPILTPLAVDPGHPFPYISNLSLNLAVLVADPITHQQRFARLKVPPSLKRFVAMPDGERFVALEQVIAAHLDSLFAEMEIRSHYVFRVSRNADLVVEEDGADDLLEAVELELRKRRFGRAVRLEIDAQASGEVCDLLLGELELGREDVYRVSAPLDLGGLWAVHDLDRHDLHEVPWTPTTPPELMPGVGGQAPDIFAILRDRDVLVHHPYESFAASVEAFVAQAAEDPEVVAMKQTLYRTSGDSPIIASLIKAAEAGKQVAALVELKARFDEQANIAWAKALENAGVHVVYGLVGLKTHSKTALVVRREREGLRRYCHIGSGNYNSRTARTYEDVGLLTSDPEIGADVGELFNFLTGYSRQERYRRLLVSPVSLRPRLTELIEAEADAGEEGSIVLKLNNLTDPQIIDALYKASQAGVSVSLIVRGICCLRPGVEGLSERIRVRSIVGRFLEHSRIYRFGGAHGRAETVLIGSADLMERNLDRRVEAVVPVEDPELIERLNQVLALAEADDTNAWELGFDGTWKRVQTVKGVSLQVELQRLATERARLADRSVPPSEMHNS